MTSLFTKPVIAFAQSPIKRVRTLLSSSATIVACFLLLSLFSLDALSQITRPFTIRYSTNDNGDIKIVGNAVMTCGLMPLTGNCATAATGVDPGTGLNNNNYNMRNIDIDGDATTFNSSQAMMTLPPGSTVKWAGLYWGATSTSAQRGQVLFKTPTAFGYSAISASVVDTAGGAANNYSGFADVTSLVQTAGSGVYTVANVQTQDNTSGVWGGWVLVAVYQNLSDSVKNMVVYDGYGLVNNANPVTIVPSGFLTPLSGPVVTRVGASGYDGDLGLTGDGFSVNGTALTDSLNQTNNFFNSVISENGVQLPGRNPSFVNNFGVDVDRVNVPTGIVPNGATSATLQLTAPSENYHPNVVTFATDIYVPIIASNVTKTLTDLNGPPLLPGDTIRWTIAMSNTGFDTGTNLIVKDPIPANTTFVANSLNITSGANAGAKSDTSGNDQAEYETTPAGCSPVAAPCVIFRLGTGATSATGGSLAFGQSTSFTFDTTVNAGIPAGTNITNSASVSYSGQTLGATFSTTSASATGSVMAAPTIAKSFSPNVINTGGTSTLTIVVSNPAANPSALTGVSFADSYLPTPIVNAATPAPNVVCTGGSTPGTITGGTAGGTSIGMSPGATIQPGGSCTVTVQVTSPTAGGHVNTTGNVTSTNGGNGSTASATLYVGKISIDKTFSSNVFEVGGTVTITFTLTNNTGANATAVTFSDTYPGGIANNNVAGTTTCTSGVVTAANGTNTLTLTGATLNSGASCTVTKQVTGNAGGVFTNITSGATRAGDAVPGNPASAPYTVVAAPTVVKSFSPNPVNVNDTSQLSITITNPNTTTTVTRAGAAFLDTYPGNLVNTNPAFVTLNCSAGSTAAVTAGTGSNGGNTIGLSNVSLAPGGSCTVTSNVTPTNAGNKTNPAFVVTFDNAPDPTAAAAVLTVTTLLEPTVTKTFVTNPILVGGTSVMRIVITNPNATGAGNTITGISFTDIYPSGLVNAAVPNATISGGSCSGGTLTAAPGGNSISLSGAQITATAAADTCTIDVTVTAALSGAYFNSTGSINTANTPPQAAAGTATLNVLTPPTITKSFSPTSIASGATSTLTIVIANPGTNPINLTGVSFTDVFPNTPGAMTLATPLTTSNTCTAGSTAGTLQDSAGGGLGVGDVGIRINPAAGATLAPNGSCTITANVTAATAGNYSNTTTAVTSTNGGTGTTANATLSIAKLGIAKAFAPTTIANGGTSVLTFTISNPTGAARTGLTFNDDLGAVGLSMANGTVGGSCTGLTSNAGAGVTNFQVTAGNVPAPGPCTITINVTSTVAGTHDNQASGVAHSTDAVPGAPSNIATLVVLAAPLVAKNFSPTIIGRNGTSLLTISLTNLNAVDMTAASFTDTYPVGMTNTAAPAVATTCTGGTLTAANNGPLVSLSNTTIPANSTCVITVSVTSAAAGSYANSISAGALTTSAGANISPANATLTVLLPPTATKSFAPAAVATNENSLLTITLTNPNANAITGLAFTDTYPANLRNAVVPNASTTCSGTVTATPNGTNPGVLSLTGGTIPANGSCTVTVNVVSANSGIYTNSTGNITTSNAGTGTGASDILTVGVPNIDKIFSPTPIQLGQNTTLTFTLGNGTNAAMTAVAFTDTFPAAPQQMVVATPSTTTNTCGGTFTATAGATSVNLAGGTIPANSTCTISVVVGVPVSGAAIGTYNNVSGAISAAGPLTGNTASASLVVTQAVPVVNKAFAGALTVGGTQTLTFTVTQPNGNPTQTFSFTDTLPAGLVVATPSTVGGTCSGGSVTATAGSGTIAVTNRQIVNPGTSCTITVLVTNAAVPTVGTCPQAANTNGNGNLSAMSNVTGIVTDSAAGGGTSTTGACVTVNAAVPVLDKAFSADLAVGGSTNLTFTITQPAGNPTQTFSFTDTLPAGLVANGGAVTGTCSGGTVTATAGSSNIVVTSRQVVNPATSCTIIVPVTTSATPTVSACGAAPNANTNSNINSTTNISASITPSATSGVVPSSGACVTVTAAVPTLNKAFGGILIVGTTQSLTFTVSQPGGNPTQAFSFTDTLPAGLVIASPSTVGGTCAGGTVTATAGSNTISVASRTITNAQTSCSITVDITTSGTPTLGVCPQAANTNGNAQISALTNIAAAIADVAYGGGVAGAAGSGACIAVNAAPSVAKTFGAASINDGASTSLIFTLTNSGTNPAQSGITVGDTLPAGLQIGSATPAVSYSAGCSGPANAAYNSGTRVLSGLSGLAMANGTVSCTVSVAGVSNATGVTGTCPQAAQTNLAASVTTTGASNTSTDQCLTVNKLNPSVAKTFGAASINDGASTSLIFTLTNSGTNPAQSGITVGDTLPAGLQIGSATPAVSYSAGCSGPANAAYNSGTRVLSGLSGLAMANGTVSCTVSVAGVSNATGVTGTCPQAAQTNLAASVTTTGASNTSTDQCLTVNKLNPSVAKTFGAASINDGASTSLIFTLTNSGTNPAQSGITVGDTLPAGLQIGSATPAVSYSAGCSGPANAAYNSGTRVLSGLSGLAMANGTVSCTVSVAGVSNATGVTGTCPQAAQTNLAASVTTTGASNTSTDQCLTVNKLNPSVAKTFGAASINDGASTSLIFTLTNSGTNPAQSGITVGDTLPAGLQIGSATPAVSYSAGCSGPANAAYNSGTRVLSGLSGLAMANGTVSCTVSVAGVSNATGVTGTCPQAAQTNLAASVTTTGASNTSTDQCLTVNKLNPSVAKTFGAASINDGASTSLIFTLTNSGTNPAQSGITVGDTLPAGLQIGSATPAVSYSAGCSGPANAAYNSGTRVLSGLSGLAMANGTVSCTVSVAGVSNATGVTGTCPQAAQTNLAASVTTTGASNTSTDQCLTVNKLNPSVAKTFGAASINDGASTSLIFTLTNSGTNPAQSGITVGDTLPAGLQIGSATPAVSYSAGCSGPANAAYNSGTRVLSGLSGLAMANGTVSCTVSVAGVSNATGVTGTCPQAAQTNLAASVTTTGASNTSTDQCLTVNKLNPSVAKTFGAASINDGASTSLIFTLTNSGTNPAQSGITVGDTLPAGLQIGSATPAVSYSAGCSGPANAAYNSGTRVLSGLSGLAMANGTVSCTVSVAGVSNATGVTGTCPQAAQTNLAASVTTTGASNTSTDQCLTVNKLNPSVAKTFGAASINDGASTSLIFTLTNSGTNPAQSGITVGDTLPAGLQIGSATPAVSYSAGCSGPANAAYNSGTRVLSGLSGLAMANGTVSCTVSVAGVSNATGVTGTCPQAAQTNLAASVTTTGASNTSTDQCLTVNKLNPSVAKTFGAASINDGASTSLIFTLTNSGTNPAQSGITVGDTLPAGLQIGSATPAVSYSAGCSGPANAAYNSGTRVLSGLSGLAMANGTVSCTVSVAGVSNATGVTGTCPQAAQTNLAASVTTTGASNTSTDQCLTVNKLNPSVAKTFGAASINDGASTSLIFTLTNSGTNPAQSGITVGDTLPAGLQIGSATPAVSYSAGCSGPANAAYNSGTRVLSGLSGLAMANGTVSCTVSVAGVSNATGVTGTCPQAAQTNLAASVTTTGASNTSTDQCLTVNKLNPSVAKTFGAASINDGASTSLIFTLTNSGTNPAQSGITVGDTLPAGLQIGSATPAVSYSAGCSGPANAAYNSGTRVLSGLSGLAMANGTVSCTVSVAGVSNATGVTGTCPQAAQTNLAASVTTTGASNTSTDQCLTVNKLNPSVAKTFGAASINDGASTSLIFTLTNSGTNPAQSGITVGDTLPAGLQIGSATPAVSYSAGCSGPANAAYNSGTRVLSGLSGLAMANGTVSCTVSVAGVSNATGVTGTCPQAAQTNLAASVTTTGASNTSTDQCLTVNKLNPSVAKTFGAASINDGASTSLIFTLTNSGTNPAQSGITVGDTLPAGLQIGSATPAVSYSAGCSGPANAAYNSGTRVLSGLSGLAMANGTVSCTVSVAGVSNATGVTGTCPQAAQTNLAASVTTTGASNTSTDQCLTVNKLNPSVAKTFGAASINDGASTSLIFTLTNSGTNPAQSGITVGDTLPAGLQIGSATPAVSYSAGCSGPANAAYNSGTRVLSGLSGLAMANGTVSCTVSVAGVSNATGVTGTCPQAAQTNLAASVTTTGASNTSTDQCLTVNKLNPSVAKTFGAASINDGASTSLIFTLTNSGTNPAQSGITVGDTLPAGLQIGSATPAVSYSAGCSGPANAAYNSGTRVLSGLSGLAMANGTVSCTVSVAGVSNATGVTGTCPQAAQTNLAASVTTTGASNTSTDQCLTVNKLNPSVAKTFGAASINDGASTSLIFTLTNSGTNPAQSGITVGDTLPAGLQIGSATPAVSYSAGCSGPANAAYNSGTRVLSGLSGLAMANGTVSCTVSVAGVSNATGVTGTCPQAAQTNLAASVTTTGASNTSTDQCLTVNKLNPSVAKTFGAASINDGASTSLIFTLTNSGTNPAQSGITVGDTLPAGLQIGSATPAVSYSAGCSGPANAAYNSGTRVLSGLSGLAMANGTVSCTVSVAGVSNATGVTGTCPQAAQTNLAASVTTTGASNTSTDQCLTVNKLNPSVAKTFGAASINDGASTSLIFTLTNSGTNPAQSGITVGDTLPAGLQIGSATPAVSYSAGCSGPANAAYNSGTRVLSGLSGLAMANGTVSCTVSVAGVSNATGVTGTCPQAAQTNLAASVTTTGASNTSTDQCLTVNKLNPSVAKTFGAASINDGASTSLIFTLTNSGTNPAQSGITVGDTLPAGLQIGSATPAVSYSAGCSGPANAAYNSGTRVLSGLSGLAMANGTVSCTVSVAGVSNATGVTGTCPQAAQTNLAASVTTTGASNTSTDQCLTVNKLNPSVAKTFGAASINDGASTSLIFTLTNSGTNPAQSGITVGDTLPAGLQIGSATPAVSYSAGCSGPANAAYNSGTRVLSGLSGLAMANGTVSCTVSVAGVSNATGVTGTCPQAAQTNLAASVTTTGASNTSTDQCLTVNKLNPSVAKTFGAASINDGASTSLIFTLTNSGTNPAQSGITVGDTLPAGLQIGSATPAVSYSAGCSGPANAAYNSGTRVLSGLSGLAMANGTVSCTVSVAGVSNATGVTGTCPQAAQTNLAASVTTTGASNTSTDQCLTVNKLNPSVAKTFGAASINDGASTSLIFTLTNSGTNPAQSGITVGDTLPAGLQIGSATPAVSYSAGCSGPANAAYNSGTRVLSGLSGLAMANGTVSCTVSVAGVSNATGVTGTCPQAAQTNLAASVTTTGASNTSTDQCLTVNKLNPSVAKTFGAASINDGASTSLIFTLTNSGTNPAQSGITVGDTLPAGLQIGSATPAVSYSAGCSGPANAAYNSGTRVLSGLSGLAMANGTVSCTVSVAGVSNATGVTGTCPQAAQTNLAASVTTTGASNTSTDQCLTVNKLNPSVAKTFGAASINDGASTSLIFTLTNSGTNPAQSGITVGDTLPAGLQIGSATPAVSYSAGCSGPANAAYNSGTRVLSGLSGLAMANGTVSCTVSVAGVSNATGVTGTCPQAAQTNLAASVTTTGASNTSTDQCLTVNKLNPSVAKTFGAASINDGASTSLIFTLTNSGTNPAQSGITVGDTLPAGLQIGSATPAVSYSAGCSGPANAAYNSGTRVLSGLSGLAMANGTVSCTVSVAGVSNATGVTGTCPQAAQTNLAASVTTTGASNTSTDQCLTVNKLNPSVAKTFGAASINDGASTSLIFTLTNSGTNPAQSGITVGDTLPAGLQIGSATPAVSYSAGCSGPANAAYNSGTRVLSGLSGLAMANGTVSCTVSVAGVSNATGVTGTCPQAAQTNLAASVTTTGASNTSTDQCLTVNKLNPSVAKTFGAASINDGASTSLIFTLTNSGTNPAQSGITVGDTLPAGLQIGSATPAVSYSAGCSGPANAAYNSGTRVLSGLSGLAMANGTVSCTVSVAGVSNATGVTGTCPQAAQTNLAASVTTTGASNTSTDQCLTVNANTLTLTKVFLPATMPDGGTTVLRFTLNNSGTNPARSGINFTDSLPSALRVAAGSVLASSTCSSAGTVTAAPNAATSIVVTGATMPAGQASCTIDVQVTNAVGQVNTSCAASPPAFTNGPGNISALANVTNAVTASCVVVTPSPASIAIGFGPSTVAIGVPSTLTYTLSNTNSIALTSATFTNLLSGMSANATGPASGTCVGAAGNSPTAGQTALAFTGLTIPAAGSCTVTIPVSGNVAGVFPNTTSGVTTTEAAIGAVSNTANLTVTAATPGIAKAFLPTSIVSGGISTLTITITNPNAAAISVTSVTDTFPVTPGTGLVRAGTGNPATTCAGGVVTSTVGSVSLAGGTVPANGSCTVSIDVTAPTTGSYINTIAAGALVSNAGANTAPASATLTVAPSANVSVTKAGPATIQWGTTLTYTVMVSNAGPDAANATVFNDDVPAALGGLTAVCGAATGGAVCGPVTIAGANVSSAITSLPAGASVTFTLQATAPQSGTLANFARAIVPAGVTDPDDPARTGAGNNTSATIMTTVLAPDLRIGMTAVGPFTVGGSAAFTLTPNNASGTAATIGTVTVTDVLPPGLTYVAAGSGGAGWTCTNAGQTVTCTSNTVLPPGGVATPITINVAVSGPAAPSVTNTASVSGGNEPAVNTGNNSAVVTVPVGNMASNSFLTDGAQTGLPGTSVVYSHVFNAGMTGVVNFSATDIASPATPGWTTQIYRDLNCNGVLDGTEGSVLIAANIAVNPGDQVCVLVRSNIPAAAPYNAQDAITASATFTPTAGPNIVYTRQDVTTVGSAGGTGLVLAKSVRNVTQAGVPLTANAAKPGDVLEYVITYTNSSPTGVSAIVISDNTPAFTTLVNASCGAPLPAAISACNVTTQPIVGGTGNLQWTLAGTLNAAQSGTVVFRVTVQ